MENTVETVKPSMTTKSETSSFSTFYGTKLPAAVSFDYTWTEYPDTDAMVAAKAELTLEEQLKVVNTDRQIAARAAALTIAQKNAGLVKPTAENNDQVRLKELYKNLQTAKVNGVRKYTDAEAREVASTVSGVAWVD